MAEQREEINSETAPLSDALLLLREEVDTETMALSDALLLLLRVEGHEGTVELNFKMVDEVPHMTRIRRHDVFSRGDIDRDF